MVANRKHVIESNDIIKFRLIYFDWIEMITSIDIVLSLKRISLMFIVIFAPNWPYSFQTIDLN